MHLQEFSKYEYFIPILKYCHERKILLLCFISMLSFVGCNTEKEVTEYNIMENAENTKKHTVGKIILGGLILIATLVLIIVCGIIYITRYKIHNIDSKSSPDGLHEIILQQIGDPYFPFGYTHARIILKNESDTTTKYKFDVANDGGNISENAWHVIWQDDYVEIIVVGEEQYDQQYDLYYDGSVETKQLDTQYGVTDEERHLEYERQRQGYEQQMSDDVVSQGTAVDDNAAIAVDEDGYPLDEEWQSYKKELLEIAHAIGTYSDVNVKFYISAKGYPYAILKKEINENSGETVEHHLIFNEGYSDSSKHEYVLEKYNFSSIDKELPSTEIIDFYLINCATLEVTDEQINTWH